MRHASFQRQAILKTCALKPLVARQRHILSQRIKSLGKSDSEGIPHLLTAIVESLTHTKINPPTPKMPYTVIVHETRHPSLTPTEFADHYDNVHIPLLKEVVGEAFPVSHHRYYFKRAGEGGEATPLVFYGTTEDFDYDAVVLMIFEDIEHFIGFKDAYEKSPRKAEIDAEEDTFIIKSKMKAVASEDAHVTLR